MPNEKTIMLELHKLNLRLSPSQAKTPDELQVMTDMLMEDLEGWGDLRFIQAVKAYRKSSPWMPTGADLIRVDAELPRPIKAEPMAIEMSPEQVKVQAARNVAWSRKIQDMLAGGEVGPLAKYMPGALSAIGGKGATH